VAAFANPTEVAMLRRWTSISSFALALVVAWPGSASLILVTGIADATCGYGDPCVVWSVDGGAAHGVAGDTFEIALRFRGGVFFDLGPEVRSNVLMGVSKLVPTLTTVDVIGSFALTDSSRNRISPWISAFHWPCDAFYGCSFGGPLRDTPEFANLDAYGLVFRAETSASEAVPLVFQFSPDTITVSLNSPGATLGIPEPATGVLLGLALFLLGTERPRSVGSAS
jgi:hypothetical protein